MTTPARPVNPWLTALVFVWATAGIAGVLAVTIAYEAATPKDGLALTGTLLIALGTLAFVAWLACSAIAWQMERD